MSALLKFILISLAIGVANAVVFVLFEFIVNQGTEYLWNELFNTDSLRLALIPVAIFLSIAYSYIIRNFKQNRVGKAETNFLEDEEIKHTDLNDLGTIFVIGAGSLLAGASLGPEASLVGIAGGLGIWFAQKSSDLNSAKLLAISSVGALLVAFFGSLLSILIPIIIIFKKEGKIVIKHYIPPIIAGVAAYATLVAIKGSAIGFGTIPTGSSNFHIQDLIFALILGILGAFLAYLLKLLIKKLSVITKKIDNNYHWLVSASVFGAVIGILYLIGGPSVEFSGKEGTSILLENSSSYTVATLLIIFITKLLVTGWSLAGGYRGGLVFPSVFMGVTLSLIFEKIHPALTGPGIIIGSVSGIFTALISPIIGLILILSMIPAELVGVALAGFLGALIGAKIISKLEPIKI
ncbi:MAG: hypothetical protein A3A51_00320 [Candidatus Levybacteria bacterium RIFCSPLOWO2_01_FULL_39_10]|nr:MAG: hypothetical protein A3A51_00320 [Candidatus Levybacteria bacterium RIFCSPLOWO2_01_FULL_39_10]